MHLLLLWLVSANGHNKRPAISANNKAAGFHANGPKAHLNVKPALGSSQPLTLRFNLGFCISASIFSCSSLPLPSPPIFLPHGTQLMGEWAEVTPSSNETMRGHVCKMLWRGWQDFLALFVVVFVWCRRLRRARWHLQRNASALHYLANSIDSVRETETRELRHSQQTPEIILSMPLAEPIPGAASRFSDGDHFITQPQCIWHAGSHRVREIGRGTTFLFFSPFLCNGSISAAAAATAAPAGTTRKAFGEEACCNQRVGQNICSYLVYSRQLQLI